MDAIEKVREEALDYLTDCYARGILDLHRYEDHRDQVMAARSSQEIRIVLDSIEEREAPAAGVGTEVTQEPDMEHSALCVMGSRKLTPDTLSKPAQTTCIMGDMVIDLRDTTFDRPARITTITIMGDTIIRVPPDTVIHNQITAILADVKDKDAERQRRKPPQSTRTTSEGAGNAVPHLYLSGLALMADVKIKRG